MKSVQLLIPDLFLPKDVAAEACAGLSLLALEKLLSRGHSDIVRTHIAGSVAVRLLRCGIPGRCADREHLCLVRRARRRVLDAGRSGEFEFATRPVAACRRAGRYRGGGCVVRKLECALCRAGHGIFCAAPATLVFAPRYFATHQNHAALGSDRGRCARSFLPTGEDAMRWHQLFNGIQMLLHAHPLNEAREARGELPINSLWLWGAGGQLEPLRKIYDFAGSDDVLAEMFAAAADIPFAAMPAKWNEDSVAGRQLLVWTGLRSALQQGDLAAWRSALQDFENGYAQPLWRHCAPGRSRLCNWISRERRACAACS